jgi:glycosyltransferase involved in cell wall biosynthesis
VHHVHDRQFGVHFPPWLARIGRWLEGPAARRIYRRAVTVAVSPSTVLAMRTRLGWRGPAFVIPNGMVNPAVDARPRALEPTVVCLGRLVAHKRVDQLIDTVHGLRARWPTLRLHVIGRGPEDEALRAMAGDAVVVHGYLDERAKAELLAQSWLNVTLSDGEGWGLAVLESAAHGVPTVCRDVDGLRDAVRHGETGWLIGAGDTAADTIDSALSRLVDEGAAVGVSKACRDWAARFDWADSGRRFCRLVADLMAGRVCHEWMAEALVAEFSAPDERAVVAVIRRLGAHATAQIHEGNGWLLAEQCRPGDVLAALAASEVRDVRVRPAGDIERLLGAPGFP